MMILKVHEDNDKDLPILKETLNRFGLAYDEVNDERTLNKKGKGYIQAFKNLLAGSTSILGRKFRFKGRS